MSGGHPRPIRVAVVDDHPLMRQGTESHIAAQPDLELVAGGATEHDADRLLVAPHIDVLLLDVRLGDASGLAALARRNGPGPAVVVVTAYDLPQYAAAAMGHGAAGFVSKSAPSSELVAAIRRAAAGGLAFDIRPGPQITLTKRERDVVALVIEGHSNDEIAHQLGVSTRTVETHLRRLFERTGAVSRTEVTARALREGWLDLPPG